MVLPMFRPLALLSLMFALSLTLAACSGDEDFPARTEVAAAEAPAAPAIQLAPTAPPQLRPEAKPVIDNKRTTAWRPGHWIYENGTFRWVDGELMPKPTFTAVWSPDRWEKRGYGWAFIPGYWQ